MIGRVYIRKSDRKKYRVIATTGDAWVLTPADEFGGNEAFTPEELRRDFQRAQDAEPVPAAPTYDSDADGWRILSANAKFAAMQAAAASGDLLPGDIMPDAQTPEGAEPVTRDQVRLLRRLARQAITSKGPTPEETFHKQATAEAIAAAKKITGNGEALAAFETGQLEAAPEVAAEVDKFIEKRDKRRDGGAFFRDAA